MKTSRLLLACLLAFTSVASAQKPRLFVLTVGVSVYQSTSIGDLNFADDDARDLAAAFQKQTGIWNVREVRVLTDAQATRDRVRDEIRRFQPLVNADDFFIFAFSGHGGKGRLLVHDTDVSDVEKSSLSKDFIFELLDGLGCGYLVFLDACHSGSFAKSQPGAKADKAEAGKIDGDIREMVKVLGESDKPYLVFGSSGSEQKSWECETCRNGYFAQTILDALDNRSVSEGSTTYWPDQNGDRKISPRELDEYIKNAVRIRTLSVGTPQKVYSRLTLGDELKIFSLPDAPPPPSKDRDGDGVRDSDDACPDLFGTKENRGCPNTSTTRTTADADLDGIADSDDACPDEFGTTQAFGCPDRDNDGVPNKSDRCPDARGEKYWQGCPDSDGDGLPDHEDDCPNQKGKSADRGCPPPDRDGDGVPDRVDKCPDEAGLAHLEGCAKGFCEMVFIKGGTFQMGNEGDAHTVTLSNFYIGKYEVTQKQWVEIMGSNPSMYNSCEQCPVEQVSWDDVQEFLKKLNEKYPGKNYRLPTEAEWEFAAGNGEKHTRYSWGIDPPKGKKGGNIADITAGRVNGFGIYDGYDDGFADTAPVGKFDPNEFGLYDMIGNVEEWCQDVSKRNKDTSTGSNKYVRGNSYCSVSFEVSDRRNRNPDYRSHATGFRLAASAQ